MEPAEDSSDPQNHPKLQFNEVLHLLSKKVVLGRGVPEKYDYPPWRLPAEQPSASLINSLLNYSMKVQSSHIPKSEEFNEFVLSNSSLAVSGLLRHYLSWFDVPTDIVFGVLQWDPAARSGPDDFEGTPHVWLNIGGLPIDNAHVAFPPNADNIEYFYECKRSNSYISENPMETKIKLFLGHEQEDPESKEILRHNLRVLQTYSFSGHIEKYLTVSLRKPELNPGFKLYHLLMVDFIKNNFNVEPQDLEAKLSQECWSCRKVYSDLEELKTCTVCKVAKYCHRNCQRQEWKVHKLLHQELQHTQKLLQENEEEDKTLKEEEREMKEQAMQIKEQMNR